MRSDWSDDDDVDDKPLDLSEVRASVANLGRRMQIIGNDAQKSEADSLVMQLENVIDECIEYEQQNKKITEENDQNENENNQLSEEISEEEKKLDKQEEEINDQLQDIDDELAAAQAALSNPPTAQELALIKELEQMKADLIQARHDIQLQRQRLQQCSNNSNRISQNCNTIRGKCNEVSERVYYPGRSSGNAGASMGGSNLSGNSGNPASFPSPSAFVEETPENILKDLKHHLNTMSDLKDYLEDKVPEIQAEHDENTALLAETKQTVNEIKEKNVERSEMLASNRMRLAEMKEERAARNSLQSDAVERPQVTLTSMPNSATKPSLNSQAVSSSANITLTSVPDNERLSPRLK